MRVSEPVEDDTSSSQTSTASHEGEAGSSGSDSDQQQGADIPFEQLIQIQQEGGSVPQLHSCSQARQQKPHHRQSAAKSFKRENKNRPVEQSSKRAVPRHRQVVETKLPVSRDPRFESLSGNFNTDQFRKQYAFVYDETLPSEKQELRRQMQVTKDADAKQKLQNKLARVEQQIKEEQARRQQQAALKSHTSEERAAVQKGKQPFFLKRSAARRQELVARYKQLKASGGLEKVMQKRRRKNAMKDHRYVPAARAGS